MKILKTYLDLKHFPDFRFNIFVMIRFNNTIITYLFLCKNMNIAKIIFFYLYKQFKR